MPIGTGSFLVVDRRRSIVPSYSAVPFHNVFVESLQRVPWKKLDLTTDEGIQGRQGHAGVAGPREPNVREAVAIERDDVVVVSCDELFCVFAFTAVVNERDTMVSALPSTISKSCSSLLVHHDVDARLHARGGRRNTREQQGFRHDQ